MTEESIRGIIIYLSFLMSIVAIVCASFSINELRTFQKMIFYRHLLDEEKILNKKETSKK